MASIEELTAQVAELRKKNEELENQVVDLQSNQQTNNPQKRIDPVYDNPEWVNFEKEMRKEK